MWSLLRRREKSLKIWKYVRAGKWIEILRIFKKFFFHQNQHQLLLGGSYVWLKNIRLSANYRTCSIFGISLIRYIGVIRTYMIWVSLESSCWAEQHGTKISKIGRRNPEKIQNEEILELVIEINRKNRNLRINLIDIGIIGIVLLSWSTWHKNFENPPTHFLENLIWRISRTRNRGKS